MEQKHPEVIQLFYNTLDIEIQKFPTEKQLIWQNISEIKRRVNAETLTEAGTMVSCQAKKI